MSELNTKISECQDKNCTTEQLLVIYTCTVETLAWVSSQRNIVFYLLSCSGEYLPFSYQTILVSPLNCWVLSRSLSLGIWREGRLPTETGDHQTTTTTNDQNIPLSTYCASNIQICLNSQHDPEQWHDEM